MKVPKLTPVKSSNVAALGHSGNRLFVRFNGGGLYSYDGVSEDLYREGLAAESAGRWFREKIQGTFSHTRHDA